MSELESRDRFLFYSSGNNEINIHVMVEDDTVWVTQKSMAEIFDTSRENVTMHLQNILKDGELEELSVCKKTLHTAQDRKRYSTKFYNLDAIISVGYRISSYKATQFRIWATKVLKEYLIKGFAMDDERLKQGKTLFGKDYFDELLERIRGIRASERRFYQKVTDIYIECSYDYDKNSPTTIDFFAHAQNKLEYAITGMTAGEILRARSNCNLPNMGLSTWSNQGKGGKITQRDVKIAKNYLKEEEISNLNRLVNMFLDFAENLAKKGKKMAMSDWHNKLDDFLKFNEYQVLQNYGKIKKDLADGLAIAEYKKFKSIQDDGYRSDFDKAVEQIMTTGKLPKAEIKKLRENMSDFDEKLKQALELRSKI
ncbi:MAG: virulence RhuM family protein [Nitrospirae bacterium]|nr:virulence RhuM family protein [Candidatus Manganitrophaceae bacterium]